MKIVLSPDPRLREVCEPVADGDKTVKKLSKQMLKEMYRDRGVGLAAPQVGVLKRIVVIDTQWDDEDADGRPPPRRAHLGARLGCGAHLGALRRTAVGETGVSAACALEELEERAVCGRLPWLDPAALLGFPVLALDASQRVAVGNGAALPADAAEAAGVRVDEGGLLSAVADGRLLAVYERAGASLRPAAVIPGGVAGVA